MGGGGGDSPAWKKDYEKKLVKKPNWLRMSGGGGGGGPIWRRVDGQGYVFVPIQP